MWKKKKSLPPLPEGYQIYEHLLKVVGIQYREDAAHRFAVDFQNKWTDIFLLNGIDDIFAGKNGPRLTVISTSVF